MQAFDVFVRANQSITLPAPEGDTTRHIYAQQTEILTETDEQLNAQHMAVMSSQGRKCRIDGS